MYTGMTSRGHLSHRIVLGAKCQVLSRCYLPFMHLVRFPVLALERFFSGADSCLPACLLFNVSGDSGFESVAHVDRSPVSQADSSLSGGASLPLPLSLCSEGC